MKYMISCLLFLCFLSLTACGRVQPPDAPAAESAPSAEDDVYLPPQILSITVPEGYTLPRIGMMLEEMELCTVEEFIQITQRSDFSSYPLIAGQAPSAERCWRLEGYLFPDTYEIYDTDSPETIVGRMLQHMEEKFSEEMRRQAAELDLTPEEVLILASIIEKEAFGEKQMPLISSVLHNRLEIGQRLQCDVTITYVEGAIKPFLTGDIDYYNSFYNTYKCDALPAGPICNPGMSAIKAALYPAESDYYYFVTDEEQNYYYAETWEEHEINLVRAGLV